MKAQKNVGLCQEYSSIYINQNLRFVHFLETEADTGPNGMHQLAMFF